MKEFFISHFPASLLAAVMLAMSIILFFMMAADKRKAQAHKYRISEASLFTVALLGGGIGGVLGMYAFHHKTKHMKFIIFFPLIALLQLALLIVIFI